MESRARFLGHPVHQMLIVFPLGLLATALVFDTVYLVANAPTMALVAYWLITAGIVGGLVAAPFGTIDWMAIPRGTRAKRVGLAHGLGNVVVLILFACSWVLRNEVRDHPGAMALILSYCAGGLALVTAWLGGELVSRLGVGVSDGASLDASNSMTHER